MVAIQRWRRSLHLFQLAREVVEQGGRAAAKKVNYVESEPESDVESDGEFDY